MEDGSSSQKDNQNVDLKNWRTESSKNYIWYASYGSNMWIPRFMCYIQGGKVKGMNRDCSGSKDKTLPKATVWKTFPCQLFFGRESTQTWGPGGVAFLNPKKTSEHKTHMCLHQITLEQFNDILFQENGLSIDRASPLLDITKLNDISNKKEFTSWRAKDAWYGRVVYLGKEKGIPVVTMTCPLARINKFKSGELPLQDPSKAYAETLIEGLVEDKQLSEEEAKAYIEAAAASKSLI